MLTFATLIAGWLYISHRKLTADPPCYNNDITHHDSSVIADNKTKDLSRATNTPNDREDRAVTGIDSTNSLLNTKRIINYFLVGMLLAVILSLALFKQFEDINSPLTTLLDDPGTRLIILSAALLSPYFEELFFRGLLYRLFRDIFGGSHIGKWATFVVISLLFVLAHAPQHAGHFIPLIPIAVISMTCTWLRLKSGQLMPSIALHMGYNLMLVMPSVLLLLIPDVTSTIS